MVDEADTIERENDETVVEDGTVVEASERMRIVARNQEILAYRIQGQTLADIAENFGLSVPSISRIISKQLEGQDNYRIQDMRRLEGLRLDAMQRAIWRDVEAGNNFSQSTMLSIMVRRSKLFGLDAPTKVEIDDGPNRSNARDRVESKLRDLGEEFRKSGITIDAVANPQPDDVAVIEGVNPDEQKSLPEPEQEPVTEPGLVDDFITDDFYGDKGIYEF